MLALAKTSGDGAVDQQLDRARASVEQAPQLDVIGFQLAPRIALTEGPVDLAFKVSVDEWNGNKRVSLKVKDLRSAL